MLYSCMVGKNSGNCSPISSRKNLKLIMAQAFSRKLSQAVKLEFINMITRVLLRCD